MDRAIIKVITILVGATVAISLFEHAGGGAQLANAILGNANQTIATLLGRSGNG